MAVSNKNYICCIMVILSLLSPSIKSCHVGSFKDWLGQTVTIKASCQGAVVFGACVGVCTLDKTLIDGAIDRAKNVYHWDWNNPSCNNNFQVPNQPKTNDYKCSNPIPDPLHEEIFDDSCKIHDLCLKTDGRTAASCDSEFYHNMKQQCEWFYKSDPTGLIVGGCKSIALTWYAAVANWCDNPIVSGSCHWGGINPKYCQINDAFMTIYCDESCIIYRADTLTSPWDNKNFIGSSSSVSGWEYPIDIHMEDITESTVIFVDAEGGTRSGGILACMHYNGGKYCTERGSNWWPTWSSATGGMHVWQKGSGVQGNQMIESNAATSTDDGWWIWQQGQVNNRMMFRFDFQNIMNTQNTVTLIASKKTVNVAVNGI